MCTVTHRDGRVTQLDQVRSFPPPPPPSELTRETQVYIRGASVRFYVVPDMLAQAPMYDVFATTRGRELMAKQVQARWT